MRWRGSLYLRLTTLFVAMVLACGLVLWAGISGGFAWARSQTLQKNLDRYAASLVDSLGIPPDREIAQSIDDELGFVVTWTGPQGEGRLPASVGWSRWATPVVRGDWVFVVNVRTPLAVPNWLGLGIAVPAVLFLLGFGWWRLRKLLLPLRQLTDAVRVLGVDDWSARVPEVGTLELLTLAKKFNRMAERIETAWKGQSELMAAVSHEFRSPLTRMRVALEFLPDGPIRSGLDQDLRRLDRATSVLLERERLSQRPDLLAKETVVLIDWLEAAVTPFQGHILRISVSAPTVPVVLDRTRMDLVVSNLLENAARHGGPEVSVLAGIQGANAFVIISDNGPGMPHDRLAFWGTPFGPSRGGHGLGSSLVRSILRAHGGDATPAPGDGGGFHVRLEWPAG